MDRFYLFELLLLLPPPQLIRQHRSTDEVKNDRKENAREGENVCERGKCIRRDKIALSASKHERNLFSLTRCSAEPNYARAHSLHPEYQMKNLIFLFGFFFRTENANVKFSLRSFQIAENVCVCVTDEQRVNGIKIPGGCRACVFSCIE